jgi:hypothetical protein
MNYTIVVIGVAFLLCCTSCVSASSTHPSSLSIKDVLELIDRINASPTGSLIGIIYLALLLGLVSMVYIFLLSQNFLYYLSVRFSD